MVLRVKNFTDRSTGTGVLSACLGSRMKYSCALYEEDGKGGIKGTLDDAEDRMLESYVQKAKLVDGMSILDLGFVSLFTLYLIYLDYRFNHVYWQS
jgi:hypothetical protein